MFGLKEIWGLDLGSSTIKAVKLVKVKGQVVISDCDLLEVEEIEGFDGEKEDYFYEKLKQALLNLVNRKRLMGQKVAVILPGHSAMVKKVAFPTTDLKRVEKMVDFEAAQQIPFPLPDVVWDYQPLGIAESGMEYDVSLFAIKKGLVNRYLEVLKDVGLDVELIQVSPMALYNFIQYDMPPEEDENIVLIDIGAENSDLIICSGKHFLIRNIPTAGADITKAFQRKFSVGFEEAEKIKLELTDSKQSQKLFEKVVTPILNELLGDVQRTVNYFKSQYAGVEFPGVVTSGATFKMEGILQFFADRLQMGVINIDELERISVALRDVDFLYENLPRFALSIGGGLQALGEGPVHVNLLPHDIRTQKVMERKKPAALVALGIIFLTVILSYWVSVDRKNYLAGEIKLKQELIDKAKKYETEYLANKNRITPVSDECEKLVNVSSVLADVSGGRNVVARYSYSEVANIISQVILNSYNKKTDDAESLWIDSVQLERVPFQWEAFERKVITLVGGGFGGSVDLGDIGELKDRMGSAVPAGAPQLAPQPLQPGGPALDQEVITPDSTDLLLCYFKGRTRLGRPYVLQMKKDIDKQFEHLLFKRTGIEGKIGGRIVSSMFETEQVENPSVGMGPGVGEAPKSEERRYLVFNIVWALKLQGDYGDSDAAPEADPNAAPAAQ